MDKIIAWLKSLNDKVLHFGASFAVEVFLACVFPAWYPWARFSANVIVIGGGKELYDYMHSDSHDAEFADLLADALGALAAEIVIALIR